MGNQPSEPGKDIGAIPSPPSIIPSVRDGKEFFPIDAMNSLLQIAFQKMIAYDEKINQLSKLNQDLNKKEGFERGKNFEGVTKRDREEQQNLLLNGFFRVYSSDTVSYYQGNNQKQKKVYIVFFGQLKNSRRQGIGMQVKSFLPLKDWKEMSESNKIIVNLNEIEILALNNWSNEGSQTGNYISILNKQQIFYEGTFKDRHFFEGTLKIFNDERKFITYKGSFNQNNQLHDENGQLILIGKSQYHGELKNNQRDGYGVQIDEIKKTVYIGEFSGDKRNGYGQLVYKNRENIKLKAFWKDDIVESGKGVFVTDKGEFLELISDRVEYI